MIQKFHIMMLTDKRSGCEYPSFGAVDFNKYIQSFLLQKPVPATVARRVSDKNETLQFDRSIKFDYPSKVTCEKIREIISHIPGIDSSIIVRVSPE